VSNQSTLAATTSGTETTTTSTTSETASFGVKRKASLNEPSDGIKQQSIDYEKVNNLNKLIDHQKFLQELLTNKDSFVRKHIIDQNLSYLNNRMSEYLNAIGLPHQVVFQNDLSVEISEFGRELDYDNLSRGESNRVILALSFAFRDVYENLFHSINSLFIDELIDSGMDTVGVENSLGILKDMSYHQRRGIWLVSHKEELINRVPNVLRVVKSGGFTSYSS
jgi:DNA repair exonuclease SbcCD ATPase subunit